MRKIRELSNSSVRTLCVALMSILWLGACAELPKAPPAKAVYDFGLPADALADSDAWSPIEMLVGAPPWAEQPDMLYRLAYDDPQLRRSYTLQRWAAPPSQLLALHWRQQLGVSQLGNGGGCQLRVRVDEFSQVFAKEDSSQALLRGAALLTDRQGRVISRLKIIESTVAGTDGRSGAAALGQLAAVSAKALSGWLVEERPGLEQARCLRP